MGNCHRSKTNVDLGFASVEIGFLGVTISHVTLSCSHFLYNSKCTRTLVKSAEITLSSIYTVKKMNFVYPRMGCVMIYMY